MKICRNILKRGSTDDLAEINAALATHGINGWIAARLMEAAFWSHRAKQGDPTSRVMYQMKQSAIAQVSELMAVAGLDPGQRFGWRTDPGKLLHGHASAVFHVNLPTGWVGFHSSKRLEGPDLAAQWDGKKKNLDRISNFAEGVLRARFLDQPLASANPGVAR